MRTIPQGQSPDTADDFLYQDAGTFPLIRHNADFGVRVNT